MSAFENTPPTMGDYQIHTAREGFASLLHKPSGEIMHSRTDPMEEALNLYVGQSDLDLRLKSSGGPLVLWDVGLGGAANAMAAIYCYEELARGGPVRPLHMVSFENDLDSLALALAHADRFPYLRHEGPAAILAEGKWHSPEYAGLSWELIRGDFPGTMASANSSPEIIFYDMYSGKTNAVPWEVETFRTLLAACGEGSSELFTYTVSTAARSALLAAGFYVARGNRAGEKHETTIALTPSAFRDPPGRPRELLDSGWLAKWGRSTARFPRGIPPEQYPEFERAILGHPQFR